MKIVFALSAFLVFSQVSVSPQTLGHQKVDDQNLNTQISKKLEETNKNLISSNLELADDVMEKLEKLEKENLELKAKIKKLISDDKKEPAVLVKEKIIKVKSPPEKLYYVKIVNQTKNVWGKVKVDSVRVYQTDLSYKNIKK